MACQGMHSWTFSGLVGAFIDLASAYLLLCASTLAFFALKFLGFFGLRLPCPCNGLFGTLNSNYCLRRLLVDYPIERVSSIQLSVKTKFPFDSIGAQDRDYQLNLKLIADRKNYGDGFVEIEGEASCSSISDARKSQNVVQRDLVLRNESIRGLDVVNSSHHVKEGRFDLKGKGIINQRPRSGLRRRRKGLSDYAKVSSVSSSTTSCADALLPDSHSSINHKGIKAIGYSSLPVDSGADANYFNYEEEALSIRDFGERASPGFELSASLHENKPTDENESSFEEIKSNVQKELGYDGNEKNAIRILEQALEEDHAARAALYLELEKERSAAATAADEAMAMILRLQEEKASIEMEARQYQRMIEEKSDYDAEEMNILKEILVRREREKYFLEKEVEAYRQMEYLGNQQLEDDIQDMLNTKREQHASSLDLGEDPVLMLQQISESIDKKEIVNDKILVNEFSSIDNQNYTFADGEELRILGWDEEADFPKQGDLDKQFSRGSCSSQKHNFSGKTIPLAGKQQEKNDDDNERKGMAENNIENHNATDIHIPYGGEIFEQHGKDACQGSKNPDNTILDMEPRVHDVHVIDGESNLFNEVSGNKNERLLENDTSNVQRKNDIPLNAYKIERIGVTDRPSTSELDTEPDINRSSSDITAGLPALGGSLDKTILSDLRRNSMSVIDNERLKIDTEVGWLRERLRIVQEGREKLNFSVELEERDKFQLQLLEDMACQLREILHLTEHGKAMRQASLPLPSSKVMSKKRRCRSVSLGVHKSS